MNKTEILYYLISLSGVYFHWLKKYARNELSCGFLRYFVVEPKNTIRTVMALVGSVFALQSNGVFSELTQQNIGLAFMAGWVADSALNKGE